jgi:hypothetical protein
MDFEAYTVFYSKTQQNGLLIKNIHKTLPSTFLENITNDWKCIGYITIANNNIIFDTIENYNFLNLSSDSIYNINSNQIKLDDTDLLKQWLDKNFNDLSF